MFPARFDTKNAILRPKKARDNGSINNFIIFLAKPIKKAGKCKKGFQRNLTLIAKCFISTFLLMLRFLNNYSNIILISIETWFDFLSSFVHI